MDKLIITAAITGSRIHRSKTPYIPITPGEITQSAIECWEAGASIAHIHVRDSETQIGTQDIKLFKRVVEPLREETDLILCLTTSGIPGLNLPTEERLRVLDLQPELASLDAGTILLGGQPFINTPEFIETAALRLKEKGVKPELEIFDTGMMTTCLRMRDQDLLEDPLFFQFVLGTPWGAPGTPKALLHLQEMLPPDAAWSVIGIGRAHLPISMMALAMGGHIRVGMEDNIYYRRGELVKRNSQFVERIVRIANEYGRGVATPDEARRILKLSEV
ncbi:MAG: 3-keto-5-aminohexanoate cleavage protein [Candidatus Bathyarchaeota archaeon]|nr:MAG: 3-keto-5-aminohexanoate cleavage protein [Candidatus Bathyarchaeota archaeon]